MFTTSRLPMPEADVLTPSDPVVPRVGHYVHDTAEPALALSAGKGDPVRLTDSVPPQPGTGVAKA
jgi:hypothetical protein